MSSFSLRHSLESEPMEIHGIFLCSKSDSTEPALPRLVLREVAHINCFLSIKIRITVSQQHYLSFAIPSRCTMHMNS